MGARAWPAPGPVQYPSRAVSLRVHGITQRMFSRRTHRLRAICVLFAGLGPTIASAEVQTVSETTSPVVSLELRDQFGHTNSLARQRGAPVIAVIVSVRRLSMIERWERDLSERVPGIRFLNIADLPDDVPVDAERTAATLRKRVPAGVAVLMDPDRRWATGYDLDTTLPNLLVFNAEGGLIARFRGRWTAELAAQVAGAVPRAVPPEEPAT